MKGIKLYPLAQRMARGAEGYSFHPEFVPCAIRNMAQTPIPVYLATYPLAQQDLAVLLKVTIEDLDCMTYGQVALLARGKGYKAEVAAAQLLALPILDCNEAHERWRATHEEN